MSARDEERAAERRVERHSASSYVVSQRYMSDHYHRRVLGHAPVSEVIRQAGESGLLEWRLPGSGSALRHVTLEDCDVPPWRAGGDSAISGDRFGSRVHAGMRDMMHARGDLETVFADDAYTDPQMRALTHLRDLLSCIGVLPGGLQFAEMKRQYNAGMYKGRIDLEATYHYRSKGACRYGTGLFELKTGPRVDERAALQAAAYAKMDRPVTLPPVSGVFVIGVQTTGASLFRVRRKRAYMLFTEALSAYAPSDAKSVYAMLLRHGPFSQKELSSRVYGDRAQKRDLLEECEYYPGIVVSEGDGGKKSRVWRGYRKQEWEHVTGLDHDEAWEAYREGRR